MLGEKMYGTDALKAMLEVTEATVGCPVMGCRKQVERQRKAFKRQERSFCENHGIYISPSTFEYLREDDNILWDFDLLQSHMANKRESRIARDNSEDAVTWNVFRFLERQELLLPFLSRLAGKSLRDAQTIYWSHDRATRETWQLLSDARKAFGESTRGGSEPDLIILTDQILFVIEAKLAAPNNPKHSRSNRPKKYVSGGNGWWNRVFAPGLDYGDIAEKDKKYQLMRFWLLGTWMAKQLDRDFMLLNLVREISEKEIECRFRQYLHTDMTGQFRRLSWDGIFKFILSDAQEGPEKERIIRYFKTKTVGYRKIASEWRLRKAFDTAVVR